MKQIMKTTRLVPTAYITKIKESKELIQSIVASEKEGKSTSSAKQLAYKEEKLINLATYLYERSNNLYSLKKTYRGIPESILTEIIGFSGRKQTNLHLEILIELGIITKTGKPKKGFSSYEYISTPLDIFCVSGYGDHSQFTKMEFDMSRVKKAYKGNLLLNKAIQERARVDVTSSKFQAIKNNIDESQKVHFDYIENYFRNDSFGFEVADANNRRMSIFSSCKREIRELITIDGEKTIQFDLANSQPAFLANYIKFQYDKFNLEMKDDMKIFYGLCCSGQIYEYIANELYNGDRNKAKELWMKAGYGQMSLRIAGDEVQQVNAKGLELAKLFPSVIAFLDNKKMVTEYNQVALTLQKFEAKLVNNISDKLFEMGIVNITVYDEFIVKISDLYVTYTTINKMIKEAGLDLILKTDKK